MSTNSVESMISIARTTSRNVKRGRDRWCVAGMLEAEKPFRRVKGYRRMPAIIAQLRRHAERVTGTCETDNTEVAA